MRDRITGFDTLAYANRLKAAGLSDKIAEVQAEANADMFANLLDNGLATKQDLTLLRQDLVLTQTSLQSEIKECRLELESQIRECRSELGSKIREVKLDLEKQLKDLENRLLIRFTVILVACFTFLPKLTHFLHLT